MASGLTLDHRPCRLAPCAPTIRPVEALDEARPDYVLIMPWNLRKEISAQLEHVREWGGRLVVALPELEIF